MASFLRDMPRAFSLDAASVTKRAAEEQKNGSPSKIPRASQLEIEAGPRPASAQKKLPETAAVCICVYKVTNKAGDLWERQFKDSVAALWQVQISHDARPSVTFDIRKSFEAWLKSNAAPGMPVTLQELAEQAGVKLTVTDTQDPDKVGYEPWRVAFYVAGEEEADPVGNFLLLLDGFLQTKAKLIPGDFEVHLHPHQGVGLAGVKEDLSGELYTFHEPAQQLPLGIFACQPIWGRRIVSIELQPEGEECLSVVISGNTWNYREKLDAHGVAGAYFEVKGEKKYYRVLKSVNVSEDEGQKRILELFGERAFHDLAVRVCVADEDGGEIEEGTPVADFIEILKQRPSCHFID